MDRLTSVAWYVACILILLGVGCGETPTPSPQLSPPSAGSVPPAPNVPPLSAAIKHESSNTQMDDPPDAPSLEDTQPVAQFTMEEFEQNKPAIRQQYADKVVEVTGFLAAFARRGNHKGIMEIGVSHYREESKKGGLSNDLIKSVNCLPANGKFPWKQAVPGQMVTVRGFLPSEFGFYRDLENCLIVKAEGDRCAEVTDEKILEDYEADPEKAEQTHGSSKGTSFKNYRIVTGTVTKLPEIKEFTTDVELKYDDKCSVKINFDTSDAYSKGQMTSLKVGDKITAWGGTNFYSGQFELSRSFLLEKE